jgi:hypothetical protein
MLLKKNASVLILKGGTDFTEPALFDRRHHLAGNTCRSGTTMVLRRGRVWALYKNELKNAHTSSDKQKNLQRIHHFFAETECSVDNQSEIKYPVF